MGIEIGDINILEEQGPVTGIGNVNIVGWGGGRRRKHGRYWDTDIVWVGTEISGCLVNVIDSKNT